MAAARRTNRANPQHRPRSPRPFSLLLRPNRRCPPLILPSISFSTPLRRFFLVPASDSARLLLFCLDASRAEHHSPPHCAPSPRSPPLCCMPKCAQYMLLSFCSKRRAPIPRGFGDIFKKPTFLAAALEAHKGKKKGQREGGGKHGALWAWRPRTKRHVAGALAS
jgi:hypothetical protein